MASSETGGRKDAYDAAQLHVHAVADRWMQQARTTTDAMMTGGYGMQDAMSDWAKLVSGAIGEVSTLVKLAGDIAQSYGSASGGSERAGTTTDAEAPGSS